MQSLALLRLLKGVITPFEMRNYAKFGIITPFERRYYVFFSALLCLLKGEQNDLHLFMLLR